MPVLEQTDRMHTDVETAAIMGIAPQTLRAWRSLKRGGPPFVKIGRAVRYRRSAIDAYLAQNTQNATPEIND
jgi:predicted DNA-binding transcriptional regulator AlpA